jgi:hypothetical protein
MATEVVLTLHEYADFVDLTLILIAEGDATRSVANGTGTSMVPGPRGSFASTVPQNLVGIFDVEVEQDSTVIASGGKVNFNGAATVYVDRAPDSEAVLAKLDAIKGPGDQSWSIAVRTGAGIALSGVECWVATDVNGANVITDIQRTNAVGIVEFLLDPGTYFLFRRKDGFTFNNPQPFTVN